MSLVRAVLRQKEQTKKAAVIACPCGRRRVVVAVVFVAECGCFVSERRHCLLFCQFFFGKLPKSHGGFGAPSRIQEGMPLAPPLIFLF